MESNGVDEDIDSNMHRKGRRQGSFPSQFRVDASRGTTTTSCLLSVYLLKLYHHNVTSQSNPVRCLVKSLPPLTSKHENISSVTVCTKVTGYGTITTTYLALLLSPTKNKTSLEGLLRRKIVKKPPTSR